MRTKIKWYTNKDYPQTLVKTKILVDFGDNDYKVLMWSPRKPDCLTGTGNTIVSSFENIKRWTPLNEIAKLL